MKEIATLISEGRYWESFVVIFQFIFFLYGVALLSSYTVLACMSLFSVLKYKKRNASVDYNVVDSPLLPGISVIAPAYNEGVTIISNVRSLLTLNYPKYEVILVNDGSTDNSLEQLIAEFDLVEVDFAYKKRISCRPIKKFYKSTNSIYHMLMVVDKENGRSKADALNAGLNVSAFGYFLCSDVDCIQSKDILIKLIKPFLDNPQSTVKEVDDQVYVEEDNKRVIATGATIRMVNSCEVEQGIILTVRPPRKFLPRFQEMEYIRAFMLGKMGWDLINCVPNVSGALGMFDKDIAIKAGGYNAQSFGEDMDIMVRMCAYRRYHKRHYGVKYIPLTLCWTEGPATIKVFGRQRSRWSIGLAQIIEKHSRLLFNPRYGRLGLVILPYMFLFELFGPLLELLGAIFYLYVIITNQIDWPYAFILVLFVYTYSVMITTLSLLWDQITFQNYSTWREVIGLSLMSLLEPLIYHPLVVFFALKGYFNYLTGKTHSWGDMSRQGLGTKREQAG